MTPPRPACPFHIIVITSPSSTSAKTTPLPTIPSTIVLSTHDPYNTKLGSGGGTISALSHALSHWTTHPHHHPHPHPHPHPPTTTTTTTTIQPPTILILHAGGDSSRCPTQMILGKAWTCLPGLGNPTELLIQTLSKVFEDIPAGSVVVAASDVILSLPFKCTLPPEGGVIGIGAPVSLDVAKNHGVYKCDTTTKGCDGNGVGGVYPVKTFLQKPSVDVMTKEQCRFGDDLAWVDTGVVAFAPNAAAVLRELAQHGGVLRNCCTSEGLLAMYQSEDNTTMDLETFCKQNCIKVELYSHMMQALKVSKHEYLGMHSDLSLDTLSKLHDALHPLPFWVCCIPHGKFRHLGTTKELLDWMTNPEREFPLLERLDAFVTVKPTQSACVILNSRVLCDEGGSIGERCVLEHCDISACGGLTIGENCLISSLQGEFDDVVIPDGMMIQQLPLLDDGFVFCVLGVEDAVKKCESLYGIEMEEFLEKADISRDELWPEEVSRENQMIWNANLHPILSNARDILPIFTFIAEMRKGSLSQEGKKALQQWLEMPRTSLINIRHATDARKENQHRQQMTTRINDTRRDYLQTIQSILLHRENKPCNLHPFLDAILGGDEAAINPLLDTFETIILKTTKSGQYDIASRSFMILSGLFTDIASSFEFVEIPEEKYDLKDSLENELQNLHHEGRHHTACQTILSYLRASSDTMTTCCHFVFAEYLEKAAFKLTSLCICTDKDQFSKHGIAPAKLSQWVIATAPARIDLSGGWSDTPPLSYEYGGAVTTLAVTLNSQKPISARCRRTSTPGLILVTEERNSDGTLRNEVVVKIETPTDLADYSNPVGNASLIKSALIYFGLVPLRDLERTTSIQPYLMSFAKAPGMEIVATSLLPRGSGLGTSSILGGCILSAIGRCVGKTPKDLIQSVLALEQLMTTGGGWQDQVGGLIGGLKLAKSARNQIPLQLEVEQLDLSPEVIEQLEERVVLAFTGKPRLAKGILQNVLRRWGRRGEEIMETVCDLVDGAEEVAVKTQSGDLDQMGKCMKDYWRCKNMMAGGAEPDCVRTVLELLYEHGEIVGGTLCGAGGGGFMVLVAREGRRGADLKEIVDGWGISDVEKFEWFDCEVSKEGLGLKVVDDEGGKKYFDINWHQ